MLLIYYNLLFICIT